jgi:hypothetical protein
MQQSSSQRSLSFSLGRIEVSRASLKKLASEDIIPALRRHMLGDWGKVSVARRKANQTALRNRTSLKSVYFTNNGQRFCVITFGDRSKTLVKA